MYPEGDKDAGACVWRDGIIAMSRGLTTAIRSSVGTGVVAAASAVSSVDGAEATASALADAADEALTLSCAGAADAPAAARGSLGASLSQSTETTTCTL